MNGAPPGSHTSNVGVVRGGTRSNVVAERCELHVDLRSPEFAALEEAEAEVKRICAEPAVPDVRIWIDAHGWHRPMEKGEGGRRLVDIAVGAASELGFELHDAATGGASDANTTSSAGTSSSRTPTAARSSSAPPSPPTSATRPIERGGSAR